VWTYATLGETLSLSASQVHRKTVARSPKGLPADARVDRQG
jgi:hypothetical protein